MNIAILGGSFDPPHIWHYWTAQQIIENVRGIDQVWYMPDYENAFKGMVASPADRLEMLKYMETGRIRVSSFAISKGQITYTIAIARELAEDPLNHYFWIIGSDVLSDFTRWRDYQKLSLVIRFLVFPRKDHPIKSLPQGFRRVEGNLMMSNVSSTLIRDRVRKGMSIKGLVLPEVEEHIKRRNLYR